MKEIPISSIASITTDYVNSKGDKVSPKKLQKLLYYIDAWHLVHFKAPLIHEDFQAWVHGPVLPSVYQNLKKFGFNNLKILNDELESAEERIQEQVKENEISEEQLSLIYSVLNRYGSLTSFQLEMLTHSEAPWIEARGNIPPNLRCNNVITKEKMLDFYSAQLNASNG